MWSYIAGRLVQAIPVLVLVTVLTFALVNILPGDLATVRLGENATPQDVERLRDEMNLDDPVVVRYGRWVGALATGDAGRSLTSDASVVEQFRHRLPLSAELAVLGLTLSVLIGVPLGILSAVRRGSSIDQGIRVFAVLGQAVPSFWLGVLALTLVSIYFSWVPPFTYDSPFKDPWHNFQQMALPALITGYALSASVMRLTRSAMLEVLANDYIRTARAKGLKQHSVTYRHALRNALIPIVTIVGAQASALVGGTVLVESVFSLDGIGRLTFQAISDRDYPQIQFNVLVIGALVVGVNLVVDVSYGYLDPRIRQF